MNAKLAEFADNPIVGREGDFSEKCLYIWFLHSIIDDHI